ncbi:MAG: fumarate hydratase C-terminal domain-containing protein [Oscillospiraceae bacterium]
MRQVRPSSSVTRDLGAEAVRRLEVENLPLTVVIDSQGNNLYETGRAAYLEQRR